MRDRIGEVLSRLLSEKYDAKIKITFKEDKNAIDRRSNRGIGNSDINARPRVKKVK
jgi:uncharacterized protein (DUF1499 family)